MSGPLVASRCKTPVATDYFTLDTTFPKSGATNCAVYAVQDIPPPPPDPAPDASYKDTRTQEDYPLQPFKSCFSPLANPPAGLVSTPGLQYAIMKCQNFKGHKITYSFNDVSGKMDNTDYGDGTLTVTCAKNSQVVLIN